MAILTEFHTLMGREIRRMGFQAGFAGVEAQGIPLEWEHRSGRFVIDVSTWNASPTLGDPIEAQKSYTRPVGNSVGFSRCLDKQMALYRMSK